MFKEWLKQFLAMCLCVITVLSPISHAYASDYIASDESNDATYYIIEGKDVESLFDFSVGDIGNVMSWVFQFKTYTVIKKYNNTAGDTTYKVYFNTPNLQSIVKNYIIGLVTDGYTDDTYKVDDTEWVVKVGSNASNKNVITQYGFQVPNYTYMGEYPKEVMSVAGILPNPTHWWEVAWRAIKSLFGVSFLQAPDAENFNTITYLNHTYTDKSDYIIDFFKKYYLDYFERQIAVGTCKNGDSYFSSPEELMSLAVTDDAKLAAETYNMEHKDEYEDAVKRKQLWDAYRTGGLSSLLAQTGTKYSGKYDVYHFVANIPSYKNSAKAYITSNPSITYKMVKAALNGGSLSRYGSTSWFASTYSRPEDGWGTGVGLTTSGFVDDSGANKSVSILADTNRYSSSHINAIVQHFEHTKRVTTTESRSGTITVTHQYNGTRANSSSPYTFPETPSTNTYDYSGLGSWGNSTSGTPTYDNDSKLVEETMTLAAYEQNYANRPFNYTEDGTASTGNWTEGTVYTTNHVSTSAASYSSDGSKMYVTDTYTASQSRTCDTTCTTSYGYALSNLYYGNNKNNVNAQFSLAEYNAYKQAVYFENYTFTEEDFLPTELKAIYDNYNNNVDLINRWTQFTEKLGHGAKPSDQTKMDEILYRQCMITNEGEDEECWSTEYGEGKTTITMVNLYCYSGLYKITENIPSYQHVLTNNQANEILALLQSYCGPYYTEVMTNMMKLMCSTANAEGNSDPTRTVIADDPRVMPYDTDSMLMADRTNYNVTDPRVELYKSHIIGSMISKLNLGGGIGIFIKPQGALINLAGRITEISVFMQQLCNFDLLDSYGLSPTNLWTSGYVGFLLGMLALFFIGKTIIAIVKLGSKGGKQVLIGFLFLFLELAFFTAIAYNPDGVWGTVKNAEKKFMNLGEAATVYSVPSLAYLYGTSTDMEVTYYMPYLDTWSKYNTGYGILESQQQIDTLADYRELDSIYWPKVGTHNVGHWSVMLMDSFSYTGSSNSIVHTVVDSSGNRMNGPTINNNAYRVIDHFMAPRVSVVSAGSGKKNLNITQNPNYNGELQTGVVDLIVKLMNCCLCCLLSLIKLCTFLYLWWKLYVFIFGMILGRAAEGKSTKVILLETFAPTIALIGIGLYSGIVMIIGMNASGLFGIIVMIALFWTTFMVIKWWHNTGGRTFFPLTLGWLYMLIDMFNSRSNRRADKLANQARLDAEASGDHLTEEELRNFGKRTDHYFNDDGTIKSEFMGDNHDKALQNWYQFGKNKLARGDELSERERTAMRNFEQSERFKKLYPSKDGESKDGEKGKIGSQDRKGNDSNKGETKGGKNSKNTDGKSDDSTKDKVDSEDRPKTGTGPDPDSDEKDNYKKKAPDDDDDSNGDDDNETFGDAHKKQKTEDSDDSTEDTDDSDESDDSDDSEGGEDSDESDNTGEDEDQDGDSNSDGEADSDDSDDSNETFGTAYSQKAKPRKKKKKKKIVYTYKSKPINPKDFNNVSDDGRRGYKKKQ